MRHVRRTKVYPMAKGIMLSAIFIFAVMLGFALNTIF